jgi:hypothetical protein
MMAHFAELDENNVVLRVIVVHNNELLDENSVEQESNGIAFCQGLLGGSWIQTSYNRSIRKNFASIGYTYDVQRDAFIAPKPEGDGWTLDEDTCVWRNLELEAEEAVREAARKEIELGVTRV